MNKYLSLFSLIVILSSCGTSQIVKDEVSSLRSKVYHLESENKTLTEKIDNLTQKVIILETDIKVANNEVRDLNTKFKKLEAVKVVNTPPISTPNKPTKATPVKSTTTQSTTKRTYSNSSSSTYNGRCQATTKKGSQCKRMAQSGRNYCWQH